jgi:uncharacterized protein
LLWFLLFAVLDTLGTLLFRQIRFTGPYLLLQTSATLIAAILAGIVMLRWLDGRPASALGFDLSPLAAKLSASGVSLGTAMLVLIAIIMLVPGWLGFRTDEGGVSSWFLTVGRDFLLFGIAAAAEEAVFRGYAFQTIARGVGRVAAVLIGSVLFALAHLNNPNIGSFALINIFLAGVLLSVAFLATQSLWFATAVHLGWNWSMASLFDLPVSGLEIMDTPMYDAVVGGPVWFTGGAFGPEGGLAGTIAFGFGLGALIWYARRRPGMTPA